MGRGVAVACSDRSSLPEVAGDAARFFDPERPAEIAEALEELLTDERRRSELVRLGFEQASRFSWAETARRTVASYERALSGPSS
jgi:glycosyltransferase involved in cell wall biosynthesis